MFYLKGRLQPTRTIGDYYLKKEEHYNGSGEFQGPYLTCQPDVGEHQITQAHRYMVIASDGVWDALGKADVMQLLLEEREIDLSKTCYDVEEEEEELPYVDSVVTRVLEKAALMSGRSVEELRSMEKGLRRSYHDDITLAVIDLHHQLE